MVPDSDAIQSRCRSSANGNIVNGILHKLYPRCTQLPHPTNATVEDDVDVMVVCSTHERKWNNMINLHGPDSPTPRYEFKIRSTMKADSSRIIQLWCGILFSGYLGKQKTYHKPSIPSDVKTEKKYQSITIPVISMAFSAFWKKSFTNLWEYLLEETISGFSRNASQDSEGILLWILKESFSGFWRNPS